MEIEKQDLIIEILNLEMEEKIEVIRILKKETSNNLEKMTDNRILKKETSNNLEKMTGKENIMFLKIIKENKRMMKEGKIDQNSMITKGRANSKEEIKKVGKRQERTKIIKIITRNLYGAIKIEFKLYE